MPLRVYSARIWLSISRWSSFNRNPRRKSSNLSKEDINCARQNYNMERQNALRRALYRVLGTEEQKEKMFMSPAQQAVQRALEEIEDREHLFL